jgi:hypothetical protein
VAWKLTRLNVAAIQTDSAATLRHPEADRSESQTFWKKENALHPKQPVDKALKG